MGIPQVGAYRAMARFKFGDGRIGEVRYAADIKVGIAGCGCAFSVFALEADIPALSCKGAIEAPGGQLDFALHALALRSHGVGIPLKVNDMGHCALSVAAPGVLIGGQSWRRRVLNGRSWVSGPICRMGACI